MCVCYVLFFSCRLTLYVYIYIHGRVDISRYYIGFLCLFIVSFFFLLPLYKRNARHMEKFTTTSIINFHIYIYILILVFCFYIPHIYRYTFHIHIFIHISTRKSIIVHNVLYLYYIHSTKEN